MYSIGSDAEQGKERKKVPKIKDLRQRKVSGRSELAWWHFSPTSTACQSLHSSTRSWQRCRDDCREVTDDPPTQNETEDSEVNNSIFEHTQAKLPPWVTSVLLHSSFLVALISIHVIL